MGASDDSGPTTLRAFRRAAQITQEQLADRAGLSARTVRNLEVGAIDGPRRHTLDRVVAGLHLDLGPREEFLAAWGVIDEPTQADITGLLHGSASVDDLIEVMAGRGGPLTVSECCRVGADRRRSWCEITDVYQAWADDVDRVAVVVGPNPYLDLDRLRLTDLRTCQLGPRRVMGEPPVVAFEIEFGRSLRRGETHLYGYRIDYSDAWNTPTEGIPTDWLSNNLRGFRRVIGSYTVQVQFDATALPHRVRHVYATAADGRRRTVAELRMDHTHAGHVAVVSPRAGVHGIEWDWPDAQSGSD